MQRSIIFLVSFLFLALFFSCQSQSNTGTTKHDTEGGTSMGLQTDTITVTSTAFDANETIPTRFTGDGADISPPLAWNGVPKGTEALALICDDPDAPRSEPWVHWVIWNIPADATELQEGVSKTEQPDEPGGAVQGTNDFGDIGYGGPAPPPGHGTHHYHFKLYALGTTLELSPGAEKKDLLEAMEGHILGQGRLTGIYER